MNIAIVDDNQNETDTITALVKEYAAVGKQELSFDVFSCGEDFIENYRPFAYTAIFMDIYMGGITGVETAKRILEMDRHAVIIFLTSSDEHMPEAFSLHAFDYVAKPAKRDRIFKVLDDLLLLKTSTDANSKLTFLCDRVEVCLAYSDIVYIQTSEKNYLEIVDIAGTVYQTRLTFSEANDALKGDHRFLILIRGVLVNMEYIKQIDDVSCILTTGKRLPVNVKNAKMLLNTWQNFIFDKIRADRRERRSQK